VPGFDIWNDMKIAGHIDRVDQELIEGWVLDRDNPSQRLSLEVLAGSSVLGQCTADLFRKDLSEAGIGDGHCAFSFRPPPFLARQQIAQIRLKLHESDVFFIPSTHPLAGAESTQTSPESGTRFRSLWIDRSDWIDRLAEKHRSGEISGELSVRIFKFVRDGYVIFDSAVSGDLVRQLNAEIEAIWRKPPPRALIETFEVDGRMQYIPPRVEYRGGRTKLLDVHAFSSIARITIANPATIEFLSAIFDDKPKAFQCLSFWRGSQQAIHKDTAYVKVDSNPLALAATWLALEDIEPGTGELEYYVGSHRAPDYLFGGTSKWMEGHDSEHEAFLQSLHEDAIRFRQVKESFLAKSGDVLIWHADLAHGGSPIKRADLTRRSLVTHFCPAKDSPYYRRQARFEQLDTERCSFVSQYADIC
jgi:phytanoyl-CoA hydroxylase